MTTIYRTPAGQRAVEAAYTDQLGRWPVPAEQRTVPSRLGDTFVISSGPADGLPLVLLHGSGTNAMMWAGDVTAWAARSRVHAVDVVGEAGRSAPARPPLGGDEYAGWLDDVLDALGVQAASLVGASLGGWLAVDYATRRPGRVERLVCLCPGGIGRQKYGWLLPALLYRPFGAWGRRRTLMTVAGLNRTGLGPVVDYMDTIHRHFHPRTEKLPVFTDDALARLTMPVLVVVGERDALLDSRDTVRRLEHAVPHADVRLLPGVGHSIIGQGETVLAFLNGAPRTPG
ncbi:alpha/beta fold hydrolase [Micromonospora sp. KC207]|uniref:alpha/beta fold hydrolase n=1 Tax=Micromonospora sp. KC207 TaxID=2530377 RepID=UPI001047017B|nr:alpha/beta fold hydrolase [Micromonospora sp. KC207]TDC47211.1 alpha/beta fold hydrolase [Micromonospora sp. KC207]